MPTEDYPHPTPITGMTLTRIGLLADIEQIATEAAVLPEADLLNVFHSLCTYVGSNGATYVERIALAGYAIAISEAKLHGVRG